MPFVFTFQLVNAYIIGSRDIEVNTLACRLLYDVIPGLETSIVFQETVSIFPLPCLCLVSHKSNKISSYLLFGVLDASFADIHFSKHEPTWPYQTIFWQPNENSHLLFSKYQDISSCSKPCLYTQCVQSAYFYFLMCLHYSDIVLIPYRKVW